MQNWEELPKFGRAFESFFPIVQVSKHENIIAHKRLKKKPERKTKMKC